MNAGQLRQRITIQQPSTTQNAYGEEVATWPTFATTWAAVKQLSGRELWYAQQVTPLATHQVTMRYMPGVTAAMQIVWPGLSGPGRTLAISDVNNVEGRNIQLLLLCAERK